MPNAPLDAESVQERTSWVQPLAEALATLHDEYIRSKIRRPDSAKSNWASELGHPCDLYLTFRRTQGEKARPVDLRLQRIFEEGRKQEDLVLRELENMGVKVLERGVPIASSDALYRELNIGGQIDAKCNFEAIAHRLIQVAPEIDWGRKRVVIECKSLSPHLFDALIDYDAIKTAKQHYVQKWADQMLLYLLGHNDEAGLFVFKSKVTGELRFVPVLLDLEECDRLAAKALRVNAAVAQFHQTGVLPDPIPWRQDLCGECPFLAICPNSRELPSIELENSAELVELFERREALKESTTEEREVKDAIDARLSAYEGKDVLVGGRWQIRWHKVERVETVLAAGSYWTKRITKLPEAVHAHS